MSAAEFSRKQLQRLPVRHIGYTISLCGKWPNDTKQPRIARVDLGSDRYKRLGVKERLKSEAPYRVCERCIAYIESREWNFIS